MPNDSSLEVIRLQQEIKRLNDMREQTRQEIIEINKQMEPFRSELKNLLDFETSLYHDILSREYAIERLERQARSEQEVHTEAETVSGQANG